MKEALTQPKKEYRSELLAELAQSGLRAPERQLAIYREGVRVNLLNILRDMYPRLSCNRG